MSHQLADQFLGPVNRNLIRDGPLYPAIPLNVLIDLYALLAHDQFRIRARGSPIATTYKTAKRPICSFGQSATVLEVNH
jgi:hypothetical protein